MTDSKAKMIAIVAAAGCLGVSVPAFASAAGFLSTTRFGYEGTIVQYASLADAQGGINSTNTINVSNRDLSLFMASNDTIQSDISFMNGPWFYTLDTFYSATEGRAGWGNTTGNTGIGFMQLFDDGSVTNTSMSMAFDNFDGTYYTSFDFSVTGENAGAAQFSRLSAQGNVGDGGVWYNYSVNLTATGLEGETIAPGIIESTNQPTGVSGSITGLFEITSPNGTQQGFYVVDLALTMDNWAWDNRDDLTPFVSLDGGDSFIDGTFRDSTFRTVPAPGAVALLALAGLAGVRRRR